MERVGALSENEMTCADLEILLADYVDGNIRGEERSALEGHLAECAECSELARDAAGAVAFMERAAVVDAPPELVTRILFEITDGPSRAEVKPSWIRRIFGKSFGQILQPGSFNPRKVGGYVRQIRARLRFKLRLR